MASLFSGLLSGENKNNQEPPKANNIQKANEAYLSTEIPGSKAQ
jgi:hypothetical protein